MIQKDIPLDENAKQLIKKCEENEVDTSTMGACQVFLEEIDRGNVVLEDESGQSIIKKSEGQSSGQSEGINQQDVPTIVRIAFIVRDSEDIENEDIKTAANRLIRRIEIM